MINSIKKIASNKYILNDDIVIYNIDYENDGIVYSVDFDDNKLNESQATAVCEEFITEAIKQ